jgi:menaquinone-dependent protoporphyrinogen oxidase
MKVLIAYASTHGGTREIAQAIGSSLSEAGFDVDVAAVGAKIDVNDYDALVIGTAIYAGHVLSDAEDFIRSNASVLVNRPVWMFSTGPVGNPPFPKEEAAQMADLAKLAGAREHRVFGGKIDPSALSFAERLIMKVVRAKAGDFRDWNQVLKWTDSITSALVHSQVTAKGS